MAPKSKRSWFDIQMTIMAISMASVLGLWNLFAEPDRETAQRKAAEEFAKRQNQLAQQSEPVIVSPAPVIQPIPTTVSQPQPGEKIMLGGAAPQTQVYIQGGGGGKGGGGGGGGGGGNGGGGASTSTSSS